MSAAPPPALRPVTVPEFRAAKARGVKLGVISNFEPWLQDILALQGVDHLFAAVVISGVVGIAKPDAHGLAGGTQRLHILIEVRRQPAPLAGNPRNRLIIDPWRREFGDSFAALRRCRLATLRFR